MQDLMGDMFQRFFEGGELPSPLTLLGETLPWNPTLDVAEREDSIVVRAELPGMRSEDIDLSIVGNNLVISGEKKEQRESKTETTYHSERRWGSFRRTVPLPAEIDPELIDAEYRDGVLTVSLPRPESAKPRHIKVNKA
jgi:HSP20 family protein